MRDKYLAISGASIFHSFPVPVLGVTDIRTIAVGDDHVLVLTGAGTVVSWGYDQVGVTGRNRIDSAVPKVIPRLTNVQAVYAKFPRSFAMLADGSIRTWGLVPLFGRPMGHPDISPIPIELLVDGLGR